MIPLDALFMPCIVCGEEYRYLEMIACAWCDEPICSACYRQDGFCSDECCDTWVDDGKMSEEWDNGSHAATSP